jgi:hypothetical protein
LVSSFAVRQYTDTSLSHASGEVSWKNLTVMSGGCLLVASPPQEFERTQSGERPEIVDEVGLVVVAAAERQIRPPHRRFCGGANTAVRRTIEIRFSLRIRQRVAPPQAMDRCDSQMEAADPGDHFWSHAEIFVELRDQKCFGQGNDPLYFAELGTLVFFVVLQAVALDNVLVLDIGHDQYVERLIEAYFHARLGKNRRKSMSHATTLQEFAVANVPPATKPMPEIPYYEAVEIFLQEHLRPNKRPFGGEGSCSGFVESCSRYHGKLINNLGCHPLLWALHLAFAEHRPVSLSPDSIWLTVTQGLANHVNMNAERLRQHFVRHKDQLTIAVRRDDFVKGSPENPWPEVFSELSQQIKGHIGEAHDLIVADFSTTGPVERAASEVALLDAMKAFFRFEAHTLCGIPRIMLEGTAEDWKTLARRVQGLGRFDFGWWVEALEPIFDQFIAAAKGRIDRQFWNSIYKWHGDQGSGTSPYVSGWILKLFPYLIGGGSADRPFRRNEWLDRAISRDCGPGLEHFPHLPARAPFSWKYYEREFDMEFVGGLIGVRQDRESLSLRPEIGWAILDKERISKIKAQEQARVEAERERWKAAAKAAEEQKKARDACDPTCVKAPHLDPTKPRHAQFFWFKCPFCSHCEKIGLWFPTKTCSRCQKLARIVRVEGAEA